MITNQERWVIRSTLLNYYWEGHHSIWVTSVLLATKYPSESEAQKFVALWFGENEVTRIEVIREL